MGESSKGNFVNLIPKGSPLPAKRALVVTTAADQQPDMKLSVYMGESTKASANYPLSNVKLECREMLPAGQTRVRLTLCAYEHSVLRIGIQYKEGESEHEVSIIPVAGLPEEEMNRLREIIKRQISALSLFVIEGGPELSVVALGPV
jgi:molecular chaperone DnaK